MEERRICRKCLLQDMEGTDRQNIDKYLAAIREEDRVPEELYQERLNVCRSCEKLSQATCEACGCYVEFRAAVPVGSCPYKKWKK